MNAQLLSLALAAEAVAQFARQAAHQKLERPTRLHVEMQRYNLIAASYLGLPTVGDFLRAEAERYDDPGVIAAFERLAQLTEGPNYEGWGPVELNSCL